MNLSDIRAAIKAALQQIPDLTVDAQTPGSVLPPHIWISDMAIRPSTMGRNTDITVELTCALSIGDTDSAWLRVDELTDLSTTSTKSVLAALDRSPDLPDFTFVEYINIGPFTYNETEKYYGFQGTFTVLN